MLMDAYGSGSEEDKSKIANIAVTIEGQVFQKAKGIKEYFTLAAQDIDSWVKKAQVGICFVKPMAIVLMFFPTGA